MSQITVLTHRNPEETADTLAALIDRAAQTGVTLRLDEEETSKHRPTPRAGVQLGAPLERDVDLCIVLGGDGTILRALRVYAGTGVPVFAINFGEIGFLATVERTEAEEGIRRA